MGAASIRSSMLKVIRSYIVTGVADVRYQGVEVLLWRIAAKLCLPLVKLDLQILFDLDLKRPLESRPAKIECVVEPASERDIDQILDMQMQRLPPDALALLTDEEEVRYALMLRSRANAADIYRRAMRAGEMCFVARHEGIVVHSNWIRFHENGPMEGRPVLLAPGEVYTTDAYTMDEFRGKGVHEVVNIQLLEVRPAAGLPSGLHDHRLHEGGVAARGQAGRLAPARSGHVSHPERSEADFPGQVGRRSSADVRPGAGDDGGRPLSPAIGSAQCRNFLHFRTGWSTKQALGNAKPLIQKNYSMWRVNC